jgi:hypothetical protein
MNWNGVLILVLVIYGIYRFNGYLVNSRNARKQREEDLLVAKRQLAIAERRLAEIGEAYKNYRNIDMQTRIRMRTLVEERAEQEVLLVRPGDFEAAIVRMYERAHVRQSGRTQ